MTESSSTISALHLGIMCLIKTDGTLRDPEDIDVYNEKCRQFHDFCENEVEKGTERFINAPRSDGSTTPAWIRVVIPHYMWFGQIEIGKTFNIVFTYNKGAAWGLGYKSIPAP